MASEALSAGIAKHGRHALAGARNPAAPGANDAAARPRRHTGADRPSARPGPGQRRAWHASLPLTIVCTSQAALALTLVWSNTAFLDEASYLWVGRLVLGHWLHGSPWPVLYGQEVMSGSPFIYPPLGGMANGMAGLAGARILSLAFMVGATILLYVTAQRLFGGSIAIVASALWAVSEPVLRLTFATFDAMSVFLVALSAWLAVQAGWRRRGWLVACSAAALGLASATAYSGIVIDPVVIVFVFLVLLPRIGARRARYWTAWFTAGLLAVFCLLITVSGSWAGLAFTILNRQVNDYQPPSVILTDIAKDSGLIIVTALAGALIAMRAEGRRRGVLLVALGGTALVVPAAQLYFRTGWALDKHAAYGIWFAAIAGGYGCVMTVRQVARGIGSGRRVIAFAGSCALAVVAVADSRLASTAFHQWSNATSFITAFRPIVARDQGSIYGSSEQRVAEYYLPQGDQWWRWATLDMSLDPVGDPHSRWQSYYRARLSAEKYDVIALFYAAPRSGLTPRPGTGPGARGGLAPAELLGLASLRGSEPGVPALTRVLAHDRAYRLIAVGPYSSATLGGVYAIWQRAPSA